MKSKFTLIIVCLLVKLNMFPQAYCTFTSAPYAAYQPGITNFKMANINRTSPNTEGNNALVSTGQTMTLVIGQTYSFSITSTNDQNSGSPLTGAPQSLRIYIDFNQNFSFTDAGETAYSYDYITFTPTNAASATYTATGVTVPATVTPGNSRLRVTAKMGPAAGHTPPTPCNNPADPLGYHGEMEEYNVVFIAGNTNAISNFSCTAIACTSVAVTMTNNSTGSPSPSYTWATNPAAVISNTSAANPNITFNTSGTYTIMLTAANGGTPSTSSRTLSANVCTRINEISNGPVHISFSPNPFSQQAVFSYYLANPALTSVNVYNMLGQKIALLSETMQGEGSHFLNIERSTLQNSGIYFIELTSGKQTYRQKIVLTD